ncbi:hypothetical protein Zm00014a_042886 [Zea mays]|nr:hypothetical protein Zm00014a_042886 [Zea mays]
MAVMGLVSPAMLYYTHTEANLGESALALSRFSSCVMLFAYAAFVFFELSNSRRRDESTEASRPGGCQGLEDTGRVHQHCLAPDRRECCRTCQRCYVCDERQTGKQQLGDLSLGVAIGSSTQISMFVIPFSVVAGWMMGQPMDLNFHLFETASLLITVLVVALLLQDGTSNCFKGLMLILCYLIVAASFYVYADPNIDGRFLFYQNCV